MKIILTHLFDVVEAFKSSHPTFKKLMEFFRIVRPRLHVFQKHHFIDFPIISVKDFNTFCFVCLHAIAKIMV
jgi:hypothetical protein